MKEKGITLIALVVTIVILLILAGVTMNMTLGSNGLFLRAREARAQYENSTANEAEQMNSLAGDLGELLKQNGGETPTTPPSEGETPADRTGISVGDYIDYTPDPSDPYPSSKLAKEITGDKYPSTEDLPQETIKWRVLKINNDGSMDLIGNPTSRSTNCTDSRGYNNGVYVLNDICKSLYSKTSKGIIARSVKLEDLEQWLTQKGIDARNNYISYLGNVKYGDSKQYKDEYSYAPKLYRKTDDNSSPYYEEPTEDYSEIWGTLDIKQTQYSIPINEENYGEGYKALSGDNYHQYYIATRSTDCGDDSATFGLMSGGLSIGGTVGFTSEKKYYYIGGNKGVRPVVTLGSNVKITISPTASEEGTPHTITEY